MIPLRWHIAAAILCGLLSGAFSGAGIPVLVMKVFPVIFKDHQLSQTMLVLYCLLPLVVMAGRGIFGFASNYLLAYAGQRFLESIRVAFFSKMQRLPMAFFQKNPPGQLISRAMQDTTLLQNSITVVTRDIVLQPATLIGAIGFLAVLTFKHEQVMFLLIFILAIPLCIIPIRKVGKKMKTKSRQMQEQVAVITETLSQNLAAVQDIRAYNLQEHELSEFRKISNVFRRFFMKTVKYNTILSPIIEVVAAVGVGVGLYYAYHARIDDSIFIALIIALYMCYQPIKAIGQINNRYNEGLTALHRIDYVMQQPEVISDPEKPENLGVCAGPIEYRGVDFAYDEELALRNINVKLEPAQTYALVGPSGSGKTSFVNLLLRFYDPVGGAIALGGHDLKNVLQHDLRANIAFVGQSPNLFNKTLLENIRVGRPEASEAEVIEAAKKANAHEFIARMEQGYNTMIGPSGTGLSGGQRQRIALARALLKDAPILILDEATSALDSESEQSIQQALEKYFRDKTVIIIAHRFSSIRHADQVLVFSEGKVQEQGTHRDLLEKDGLYARLYRAQDLNL